jgi:sugar lactone lactonase YvrE
MHCMNLEGAVTSTPLSARVSAIGLCISGCRYVAATEFGFGFVDPTTGCVESIVRVEEGKRARMNDGGVDLAGRFFAGSVSAISEQPNGSLHCLRPDGSVQRVLGNVRLSNGIGWSADGKTMYYVDTLRRSLDRFDYDIAGCVLRGRRTVAAFRNGDVLPDGLCLDAEDRIWVALWGGSGVHCYEATGELLQVVRVPCRHVTACIFGGRDNDTLYITSAATDDADSPYAGKLFACSVGVRGANVVRFDDRAWPI